MCMLKSCEHWAHCLPMKLHLIQLKLFLWTEDLLQSGYLKEATEIFLKGAEGGYRGIDHLFDALVERNANIGHHRNCIKLLRLMEYMGRNCKTFHYNCLLMIEVRMLFMVAIFLGQFATKTRACTYCRHGLSHRLHLLSHFIECMNYPEVLSLQSFL